MSKKIKVAQIIGRTNNGGVENYILNYYTAIDRSQVEFDFLVSNECDIVNEKSISSLGGRLVRIPGYMNIVKYEKTLIEILKKNQYDIIQANNNALSCLSLFAAKKAGYKVRIANSLSTTNSKEGVRFLLKSVLRLFSKSYATHYFACSDLAGEWLFGKDIKENNNYFKINNAVITSRYQFRKDMREQLKQKHNLVGKTVVGTIGRLEEQKNYSFLLDVFSAYREKNKDSHLIIIGDGEQREQLLEKAETLNMKDNISILSSADVGVRGAASSYYSLFDVFVLPSLYEGLPTVGIEAQIADLPCIFADTITTEVKNSDSVYFLSLDATPGEWADLILNIETKTRSTNVVCEAHDIDIQARRLLDTYKKILED